MDQEKKIRNWKGNDGRFETEATFISIFQGDKIKLKKAKGGGIIAIPIQRLCDIDKEYLKQQIGSKEWNKLFSNLEENKSMTATSTLSSRNSSVLSTNINNNNNIVRPNSTLNDLNKAMTNLSTKNITTTTTYSSPSSSYLPPLKVSTQNDIYSNNNNNNNNIVISPQSPYSHYSSNYFPTSPTQQQHQHQHQHHQHQHQHQYQQQSPNIYHSNHSSTAPIHHLHQYNPVLSQPPPPYQVGNYSPTKTTNHQYHDFSYQTYHDQQQQQQQQQQQPVIRKKKSFIDLPNQVIIQIGYLLDVKSRIRLLCTSKHLHTIILHYDVWHYIEFLKKDAPTIEDKFIHQLLNVLREAQLHYSPKIVNLDHASIKAETVSFILQFFPAIRHLSIRHCPSMDYHQLALNLNQLSTSSPNGSAICQPNLFQFSMLSKKTIQPIHGSDIEMIQQSLDKLAKKKVILDCQVCDQCKIAACTSTLTCIHCGVIPIKRCLACAPSCDHCQGRVCGGDHCQRIPHLLSFQISDCGRCQLPLALCNQPACMSSIITIPSSSSNNNNNNNGIVKMRQREACITPWDINQPKKQQHGYFHSTCKIKTKLVSNQCTKCGVIACPFCELMKCGGGCHGQFCSSCVSTVDLKHCKCILIHGVVGTKMSKRNVCHQCQLTCKYCTDASLSSSSSKTKSKTKNTTNSTNTYCYRCLDLHQKECEHKNKIEKKKSKRKQKK